MDSRLLQDFVADDPLVIDANYKFGKADRQYIDAQIRMIQTALVEALIKGRNGSWFDLDMDSATVRPGHVVCSASTASGTVTLCTAGAVANAKLALGVVVTAAAPGSKVFIATGGLLPPSITGLAAASPGFVRVNTTTGYLERVASYAGGDIALGSVDAAGWMNLAAFNGSTLSSPGAAGTIPASDGSGNLQTTPVNVTGATIKSTNDAKGTLKDEYPHSVQTTDATATTIDSFTLASNTAVIVTSVFSAIKSDGTQAGLYVRSAAFRNSGGTVTQLGTTVDAGSYADDGAWAATIDFTGTTIRARVTGKAATTIRWTCVHTRLEVIP